MKLVITLCSIALLLGACGKPEKEKQEVQLKMRAEQARMDLQNKADQLARNPPPELIKAAKEQAAKEAAKGK